MSTIERLDDGRMTDEYTSWIITALITTVAFVLRVWNVGFPNSLVFDETYYPKDAWTCLLYTSPSPRDLSTSRMPSSA